MQVTEQQQQVINVASNNQSLSTGNQSSALQVQQQQQEQEEKRKALQQQMDQTSWKRKECWSTGKKNLKFCQRRILQKIEKQQQQQQQRSAQFSATINQSNSYSSPSGPTNSSQSNSQEGNQGSTSQQDLSINSSDVRQKHLGEQSLSASALPRLASNSGLDSTSPEGSSSGALHPKQSEMVTVDKKQLRQELANSASNDGRSTNSNSGHVRQGEGGGNGSITNQASPSDHGGTSSASESKSNSAKQHGSEVLSMVGLENGVKMGRHLQTQEEQHHHQQSSSSAKRIGDPLGNQHQNVSSPSVQTNGFHGGEGTQLSTGSSSVLKLSEEVQEGRSNLSEKHFSDALLDDKRTSNKTSHMPLLQKGGSQQAGSSSGGGKSRSQTDSSSGQTSRSPNTISGVNNSLHQQQSAFGSSDENTRSNKTPLAPSGGNNNSNNSSSILQSPPSPEVLQQQKQEKFEIETELLQRHDMVSQEVLEQREMLNFVDRTTQEMINARGSRAATFVRHAHSSKLPTPEQKLSVRLHSQPVKPFDKLRIKALANSQTQERLRFLESCVGSKFNLHCIERRNECTKKNIPYVPPGSNIKSDFLKQHAEKLCQDGIATKVASAGEKFIDDTLAICKLFVVIENEKTVDERLRCICWPKDLNEYLSGHYVPDMKQLQHQSKYIDSVADECAVIADLAISFYQYEIPKQYRRIYRFYDAEGNLYEFCRLAMGLGPAAEMMQIYTEILALNPTRVRPQTLRLDDGSTIETQHHGVAAPKVWVDGIQCTGSRAAVEAAAHKIEKVSEYCGVTWKKQKNHNNKGVVVAEEYDFVGIHFNHRQHLVSIADKTLNKLPAPYIQKAAYSILQLEKDVSRLLFCTGALRIIPARFYFAMKWVNRNICRYNKTGEDVQLHLPPSVTKQLNEWISRAKKFVHLPPSKTSTILKPERYDVLFTDASAFGWGAFFIGADGDIAITGGAWEKSFTPQEASKMMSLLEAKALDLGLRAFEERLLNYKNVEIRIDNTSVLNGLIHGKARHSIVLNEYLQPSLDWLTEHEFRFTVSYVNTKDNFADAPSRGDHSISNRTEVPAAAYLNRGTQGMTGRSNTSVQKGN